MTAKHLTGVEPRSCTANLPIPRHPIVDFGLQSASFDRQGTRYRMRFEGSMMELAKLTDEERKTCHYVIHSAATSAAGIAAVMAQAPGTDTIPLIAVEAGMVVSLGRVFGISLTESAAKSIVAGSAGTYIGRGVFQFLVGWVPGFGNVLNAATAAGVVETLGWAVVADFSNENNRDRR